NHAVRLVDESAHPIVKPLGHTELREIGNDAPLVKDAETHLLAEASALSRDAEIDLAAARDRTEAAVLRLSPLGDVHRREDLEHVNDRLPGVAVERLAGVHHPVNAD